MQMSNRRGLCTRLGRVNRAIQKRVVTLANSKLLFAAKKQADPLSWAAMASEIRALEAEAAALTVRIQATYCPKEEAA